MTNWPRIPSQLAGPVEVDGGLLFHPDQQVEAGECVERVNATGLHASRWMLPGDLGVFVEVRA